MGLSPSARPRRPCSPPQPLPVSLRGAGCAGRGPAQAAAPRGTSCAGLGQGNGVCPGPGGPGDGQQDCGTKISSPGVPEGSPSLLGEKADAVLSPVPLSPCPLWPQARCCSPQGGALPCPPQAGPQAPRHGNQHNSCPAVPWLGRAQGENGRGLHGRGCTAPQHTLSTPQPGAHVQGTGSPWWRQCWPAGAHQQVTGLYTGSSLRRLLGCCWLLQESGAQSREGTQAGGHRTRTAAAASTAGGAEEPQG